MPSPLLQLRIPQDLADWLEAKFPSRGGVATYVRQLLTTEQMKEAVAPLVPDHADYSICSCGHPETLHRKNGAFAPCQIALCECQQFSWPPVPEALKAKVLEAVRQQTETQPNRGVWKGTAAEWAAFQEGAGFETPEEPETIDLMVALKESIEAKKAEPRPKARRKKVAVVDPATATESEMESVRKVPDQPVSVKNRGGSFSTTQELSSKNVKGSPTASVGSLKVAQTASEKETAQVVSPESPSPKPRKLKTCPHDNTIRKLGMPFCEDCGEFV